MKKLQSMLLLDFYKLAHRAMYPDKTEQVYSTWTPRRSRIVNLSAGVNFGVQGMIKELLIEHFNEHFFAKPRQQIIVDYKRFVRHTLLVQDPDTKHIEALHDLGYLPLEIRALPEGTVAPVRVPTLVIWNTKPEFFWLTNYLETILSIFLWLPATSATIANQYRLLLEDYARRTGGPLDFVQFQGHDFSMRGMGSLEAAYRSGGGHMLSFVGTDTCAAILYLEEYYNANIEKELVGCSVNASEHSVECAYQDDLTYIQRLIEVVYPTGIVSAVSDGRDLWKVLTEVLPALKDKIMARDGKLVIRPDSGDPVKIVCGTALDIDIADLVAVNAAMRAGYRHFRYNGKFFEGAFVVLDDKILDKGFGDHDVELTEVPPTPEMKGVVELLWDVFFGEVNAAGFKQLDPHIGVIYGDAITLERAKDICEGLMRKQFASTNIVFGIGSFTYQYNTRDTLGFALKSTLVKIDGNQVQIFKEPATDDGTKFSQRGAVSVTIDEEGEIGYSQGLYLNESYDSGALRPVFRDGKLLVDEDLATIRKRLRSYDPKH